MLPKREVVDAWAADGEPGNDEEAVMRRPVERTMLVNHLGPWLLTALLLPTLKDTGRREGSPSRVIFVSSRLEGRGNSARFLEAWLRDPAVTVRYVNRWGCIVWGHSMVDEFSVDH